jgi:hypothetical protein
LWLRVLRYDGSTVPALRLDGRRVVGSLAIMRALGANGDECVKACRDRIAGDALEPVDVESTPAA